MDGVPYVDQSEFDLDFESSTARGFYTGGQGYQVSLDNQTYHAGSQSLQMRYVYQGPAARAAWKPIVGHLERLSARPTRRRVPGREARWAAQNARVVLQSLQMLNNEVSRDESMAANIKWILDESPTAKIVLWAHNAHVKRAWKGPRAMGSFLSEMYGDQMVVFGFAFNQGSFQAVDPNVGLRNFTIGPAIPGSLDAILAATEIPIFALDMRHLPPGSVLSPWLANFHSTRSIGATFSYDWQTGYYVYVAPSEYFDSLLFVETTTAARKN